MHSDVVYSCPVCDKNLKESKGLKKHIRNHLEKSNKKRKADKDIHPSTRYRRAKQEAAEIEEKLSNQPDRMKSLILNHLDAKKLFEEIEKNRTIIR